VVRLKKAKEEGVRKYIPKKNKSVLALKNA